MVGVIDLVGGQVVLELFQKTQKIESEGGMMIKNGERRRTPGGVFMQLLRDAGKDECSFFQIKSAFPASSILSSI